MICVNTLRGYGVLYFTGHIAAGKQPTMTEQMVALTHRLDELLEQFGSDKNHILYAKINIHDWSMFDEFNAVWDAWFDPGCMHGSVCFDRRISG